MRLVLFALWLMFYGSCTPKQKDKSPESVIVPDKQEDAHEKPHPLRDLKYILGQENFFDHISQKGFVHPNPDEFISKDLQAKEFEALKVFYRSFYFLVASSPEESSVAIAVKKAVGKFKEVLGSDESQKRYRAIPFLRKLIEQKDIDSYAKASFYSLFNTNLNWNEAGYALEKDKPDVIKDKMLLLYAKSESISVK